MGILKLERDQHDGDGGDGHADALATAAALLEHPGGEQDGAGRVERRQHRSHVQPAGARGREKQQVAGDVKRGPVPAK